MGVRISGVGTRGESAGLKIKSAKNSVACRYLGKSCLNSARTVFISDANSLQQQDVGCVKIRIYIKYSYNEVSHVHTYIPLCLFATIVVIHSLSTPSSFYSDRIGYDNYRYAPTAFQG